MSKEEREKSPRLRGVEKVKPPYPINEFPADFALSLGKQIVYLLATRDTPDLEGKDWESLFATSIGAKWKPSNIGLDDVVLDTCAWGAKTAKAKKPHKLSKIRLISGRNSPVYSYGSSVSTDLDPTPLGKDVLGIWNERVSAIRKKYKHVRTVVLLKSDDLLDLTIFEFDTIRYEPDLYQWKWNKRGNLEGYSKGTEDHAFTWQPHGSQFTIIENVPKNKLCIRLKKPEKVSHEAVLRDVHFDPSWVQVIK